MASGNTSDRNLKVVEDENISKQKDVLTSLYDIWNNVGVDEDQKVNRANQVWGYIFNLLKEILDEETGLYEDIKERVRNYEKKITELIAELNLHRDEEITGTLIVREESLRQQLDELLKMKHKRVKEWQELQFQELKYCKLLDMPQHSVSSITGVPSEKDISELRQHVNMLEEEKEHRQKKFYKLKKELTTILEVTELAPETAVEKEILISKEDSFSLSNETFKILEQFVTKTKSKQVELENEKAILMDKLSVLWKLLKVDDRDKQIFLSKHTDCRVSTLNAIKEEIARCDEIKKQNIKKYADALKEELLSLMEKCFISKSEKKLSFMQDDEINESTLVSYDNEVAKLRKYYKETEHILQKINKRSELWNLLIVFENKANDPSRFKNRGGNLLQEERERNKLQKDLPALENEIFADIENFEKETGKLFFYFGENFSVFVAKQWEDRIAQKENDKMMRLKLRSRQLLDERRMGITPAKRPFNAATPKSAPSKLFKSSVGVSIYRTPNVLVSKPVPSTVAKMKTMKMSRLQKDSNKKPEKSVLKEKNENVPSSSNCLDSTTYTDFAEKLNRSSRYAHRSSVLCSKKIVGTRISINKSKRKSVNKSIQKSKKKDSSKITPVRGKLGLPFLI